MLQAGDVLDGRYQLLRDLGRGAAGVVFEARHLFTGRFAAVKVVAPRPGPTSSAELRARLQREGQAMASIRHPGVVEVLDGGVTLEGASYVVMEMLEGRTLEGLLAARTKLSVENAAAVALQLCDALGAVHRAGIVHRDVKPGNIIVVREADHHERVKLLDFGVAKTAQSGEDRLTGAGAIIGTPAYMSPEQLLALDDVDQRSDVYGVGATMFECLSGAVPYAGNYPQVLVAATGAQPAPTVRSVNAEVPLPLALVVDRAIAKSREARYATMGELSAALAAAMPGAHTTTLLGPAPLPPQENPAVQRRRARRAPYNTPVQLVMRGSQGTTMDGRTEDVSEGGLLVLSRDGCSANQRVTVRFALPMEGKVASVEADVRWVRASPALGLCAVGLAFVDLPAPVRTSIAAYVGLMADHDQA